MKSQYLRNLCFALLCAAFAFEALGAETTAETAQSLFNTGVTQYETGDYQNALKTFRRMQEDFPRSSRAVRGWEYIALCENKLGDPYAAFEAYQQIWDNHKEFTKMQVITRNQMRIGNHYMEYKRYQIAEKIFKKILENAPYSEAAPAAQYSLGLAQYNLKKYGEARESFETVCQNFPTSQLVDDSAFMLGIVDSAAAVAADYDQTSTDRAIASFRNYIREFPTAEHVGDAQAHIRALRDRKAQSLYDQAYYYDYSGHAKSAIMHYELLISEYPDTDCADKAKMRLAALRGEPVQGMPKDKVTYVEPSSDLGPVSSQQEQEKAYKSSKEDPFGGSKASPAPFDENRPVTTSSSTPEVTSNGSAFDGGSAFDTAPQKSSQSFFDEEPEKVEKQREERTTALTQPSSSMASTGEDWRQNQSRQVINSYLQDPSKKEELTSFMKEEYEKEAEAQAASAALLKLYQQNNPDAVPPPVEKASASAYIKEQVEKQKETAPETEITFTATETKTQKQVNRIENVWAPVPGTEVKTASSAPVQTVVKTETRTEVKETPSFTQPAAPQPPSGQPVSRVQSSSWQTLSQATDFGEEKVESAPPKYSTISSSELAEIQRAQNAQPVQPRSTVSYGGSTPVFHEVSSSSATYTPAPQTVTVQTAPSFEPVKTETTVSTPSFQVESSPAPAQPQVTVKTTSPSFTVETTPASFTVSETPKSGNVSTMEINTKGQEAADELINDLVPMGEKEPAVKVTVTTNTGLRVTRELSAPTFKEETVKKEEESAFDTKTEPVGTSVSFKVGKAEETTGATSQDVSSVLPSALMETSDPNKDAIVKAPEGTVIRTMPDSGRVSTAISQAQYQKVVEEKNVKDASSETTLINSYKQAYNLVQRAEAYAKQNDSVNARFYYGQALDAFTALKAQAPANWRHMDILDTRIQKCREELHRID
ncbi:outer membrane protein assembly factor BamD [bacterium]|nr:outer membrane protein assembly factor BamD [bacterium]